VRLATASHRIQGTTLEVIRERTTPEDMPQGITLEVIRGRTILADMPQGITLAVLDTILAVLDTILADIIRLGTSITQAITKHQTVSTIRIITMVIASGITQVITIRPTSTQTQEILILEIHFPIQEIHFLTLATRFIFLTLATHSIFLTPATHFTIPRMRAEREIPEMQETPEIRELLPS